MIKPALFAFSGACVTAAAYFSGACPSMLAATQLTIYSAVYGLRPIAKTANVDHFQSYVALGTFLFLSKLFEYWTLHLAGPLASQAAFFPVPLVLLCARHAFPDAGSFELDKWEIAMNTLLVAAIPILATARPEPGPSGIATALAATVATGMYSVGYNIAMQKHTEKSVTDVRALVYLNGALLAIVVCLYSFELPKSYLGFGFFVVACFAHAAARKWHDAKEGSKGDEKFAGEWNAVRAFLVVTWAWMTEWQGILVVYALAVAIRAYYFSGRKRRLVDVSASDARISNLIDAEEGGE